MNQYLLMNKVHIPNIQKEIIKLIMYTELCQNRQKQFKSMIYR